MKTLQIFLYTFLSLFLILPTANAEQCAIDPVPAKTLLIPYFEADLSTCDPGAVKRTVVHVTNVSAAPATATFRFWTDWSIPVFGFSVELAGYDSYVLDVRDLLCSGDIPDPSSAFPRPLDASALTDFRNIFRGLPSTSNELCWGSFRDSDVGVGYITIDNEVADQVFPNGGSLLNDNGSEQSANTLVGHVYYEAFAEIQPLQVNEFAATNELLEKEKCKKKKRRRKLKCRVRNRLRKQITNTLGGVLATNSAPLSLGLFGAPAAHIEEIETDNVFPMQEGLPTTFAVQFDKSEADSDFELIIWRDSSNGGSAPVVCGETPERFPLEITQIVAFDRDSDAVEIVDNPAPLETQAVSGFLDNVPFDAGWIFFNFNDGSGDLTPAWVMVRKNGIVDGSSVNFLSYACDE